MFGILVWMAGCILAVWQFWKHGLLHEFGVVCAALVALAWFAVGLVNLWALTHSRKTGLWSVQKHDKEAMVK